MVGVYKPEPCKHSPVCVYVHVVKMICSFCSLIYCIDLDEEGQAREGRVKSKVCVCVCEAMASFPPPAAGAKAILGYGLCRCLLSFVPFSKGNN